MEESRANKADSEAVFSRFEKEESFGLKYIIGPYFFKFTQKVLLILSYIFVYVFTTIKIAGKENIEKIPDGGLIIVANHKGYFDPLFIGVSLPFFSRIYPLRFMAKDQFFSNPIGYLFIKILLGSYPAFYGQGLDKSLEIPAKILERGGTVVFFPEGKCFLEKGIAPFKAGAGILASSFPNVQILPISIYGNYQILRRLFKFQRPKISVNIGKPFTLSEKIAGDPSADLSRLLMSEIERLYSERL